MPDDPDLGISGVIFVLKKRVGSDNPVLGRIIRTWGGGGACAVCNSVPWLDGWDGREKGTGEDERAIGELTVGANRAGEGQKGKHAVGGGAPGRQQWRPRWRSRFPLVEARVRLRKVGWWCGARLGRCS